MNGLTPRWSKPGGVLVHGHPVAVALVAPRAPRPSGRTRGAWVVRVFARAMKPRSNSIGLLVGAVVGVLLMLAAHRWDDGSQRLLWRSGLIGFAFVPLAIALAELRSGFAWKNLAPGNRGVSRTESPRHYWVSVAGHAILACGLVLFGLLFTPPK